MKRAGIVLLFAFLPMAAFAWTPSAEERIAKKGAALAPPDLRLMLGQFENDYLRGLEKARADMRHDVLRATLERETRATIAAIRKGEPMPLVVERLGALVHYVGAANNPFLATSGDPRLIASKEDFESYFERRLPKFPTVFYGLDPQFRIETYFDRTLARAAKFNPLLSEEYFRGGQRGSAANFDDRSTAFGVAAVCYSHSVSDLVNLYYFIWKESGGDVRSASLMRRGNLLLNAN